MGNKSKQCAEVSTWIFIGLKKYWTEKAQTLTMNDFVLLYVNYMLLQNKETGRDFWLYAGMRKGEDLNELYRKLRGKFEI